jgi:hypothetical protein
MANGPPSVEAPAQTASAVEVELLRRRLTDHERAAREMVFALAVLLEKVESLEARLQALGTPSN